MAETWEIILWVIVAAALLILICIAIAIVCVCRKRNRRKKNIKHRRFEWEKKDQTDYGKRKVHYNTSSGEAKILDQTDSGGKPSKVEYNAKTEEAKILGAGDQTKQNIGKNGKSGDDETAQVRHFDDNLMSSPMSRHVNMESNSFSKTNKSERIHVEKAAQDESNGNYVRSKDTHLQRERLQPLEAVPREKPTSSKMSENITSRVSSNNVSSQDVVKSYTNLGYNQQGQNADVLSNVRFQQPVAVVKAFVNPGYDNSLRHARTLPRNHSKLSYKKSIATSTFPRRKPVLYTWSLKPMDTEPPQSRLSLPITYREIHPHFDRRRATKHRTSARSRSFTKSSLKKKDKSLGSLKGVYITDSRPRRSYQQNSAYHRKSTRPSYFAPNKSKVNCKILSPSEISKAERENYADFYEERYKMVKKSEFPAFQSSSTKYEANSRDPEISSIVSGSEFSDFLPTPPRPSDSQSEGSTEGHSRGSYKAYKNRLEKSSQRELVEDTSHYDRAKHTKSFQETLESLRNGGRSDHNSVQREVPTTSEATSPWINNDSNFRKQHGVPITGVPVLPPEPVYIQMEDSDQSDDEKRLEDKLV